MISKSSFSYIVLSLAYLISLSASSLGGKLKNEWMVLPLMFNAATPVGAIIAIFFLRIALKYLTSVDLPVPATPVTRIKGLSALISSITTLNSSVISISVSITC